MHVDVVKNNTRIVLYPVESKLFRKCSDGIYQEYISDISVCIIFIPLNVRLQYAIDTYSTYFTNLLPFYKV